MRSIFFFLLVIGIFSSCEKNDPMDDPNRPIQMEIGENKIINISEIIFQKSSFGNQGTLYILGEGLNYAKENFTIEGMGDFIQLNLIVNPGNNIDGGIYRFNQLFGEPFSINFGQLAEEYNWGNCQCTNVTDIIMEVNPLELEDSYEFDIIGRNNQDKIFKVYYKGDVFVQLF